MPQKDYGRQRNQNKGFIRSLARTISDIANNRIGVFQSNGPVEVAPMQFSITTESGKMGAVPLWVDRDPSDHRRRPCNGRLSQWTV